MYAHTLNLFRFVPSGRGVELRAAVCALLMMFPILTRAAGETCAPELGAILAAGGRIPPALVAPLPVTAGIRELTERAERDGGRFVDELGRLDPFNGLYLRWQHEGRLSGGDAGTSYALEWEAFSDGRDEAIKRLNRSRIEHQVQYFQLLRDMRDRAMQERRFISQRARNRVMEAAYARERVALEALLAKRRQEVRAGVSTRIEVAELGFKLKRADLQAGFYAGVKQYPVDPAYADLLDRAASLRLRSFEDLLKQARENSFEFKLQGLFAERSETFPVWADDLSLRVYLERRHGFDQSVEDVLGVRLRVPLDREAKRDELVALEKNLYRDQGEAVLLRLSQKIEAVLQSIGHKQRALGVLEGELALMGEQRELSCVMVENPVSVLAATPERSLDDMAIQVHEKVRDSFSLRFEIVDALIELDTLVQAGRLSDLLTPDR